MARKIQFRSKRTDVTDMLPTMPNLQKSQENLAFSRLDLSKQRVMTTECKHTDRSNSKETVHVSSELSKKSGIFKLWFFREDPEKAKEVPPLLSTLSSKNSKRSKRHDM